MGIKVIEESRFLSNENMAKVVGGNGPLICGDGKEYKSCVNNTFTSCSDNFYINACVDLYLGCGVYKNCANKHFLCSQDDDYGFIIEV